MTVTRNPNDFNGTSDFSEAINVLPNVSSFLKDKNWFKTSYTNQTSVLFDINTVNHTLLSSVNRRGGNPTRGTDRAVTTRALPMAYFHDMDTITKADYENKRKAGTADQEDTLMNVLQEKLEDQRRKVDESHEYMMLSAIKGIMKTPDGLTIANMFTETGTSQISVDFVLGTDDTNVLAKCGEVKTQMQKALKTGGKLSGNIPVLVSRSFFDKLVNHDTVKAAYLNSSSNVKYQDLNSEFLTWGITDVWVYNGLQFMVYDHDFPLPSGPEAAIAVDEGYAVPVLGGNNSVFRAVYGPSRRMDKEGGAEMFASEYRDGRQMFHEIDVETHCLFYCEKPAAVIRVHTSN